MGTFLVLVIVVAMVWFVLASKKKAEPSTVTGNSGHALRYEARPLFHNQGAAMMFVRLCEALPEHHVHAEVGIAAFIQAKGKASTKGHGHIGSRRVDYLVTTPAGKVVCGVELDGDSHKTNKAAYADRVKDEAFRLAGVRLVRITTDREPKGDELRRLVLG